MKERTIETHEQLAQAVTDIGRLADHLPFVISITQGKRIRSTAANARYWSGMKEALDRINEDVESVAESTGYTNLEARRVISESLPWEQSMMLCVRTTEAMHEVAKMIVGIPTSTKLGTKEFQKFELQIEQVIAEIVGEVKLAARKATT